MLNPRQLFVPLLMVLALSVALNAQQTSAPQVGVYHCTNGFTLTISRCDKYQGQDACFFKIENKGQVLMDSPGTPAGVDKIVRKCKGENVDATPAKSAAASAGPTNPAYLSEMPAPARVLAEIKGKDEEDTGERQMGAYRALVQIIDDMAYGLSHRNVSDADNRAATPDEKRIRFAYETAYADLWHKVTNKEGHVYDHDPALRNELLAKFFSENFRAQYFQANKNAMAAYKAFQDKMYAPPPAPGTNQAGDGRSHLANDAGSVAVRHCVESGRSELECLGEGMKVGLNELAAGTPLATMIPPPPTGLRLTGVYGDNGFALMFSFDYVTYSCGPLLPQGAQYTVERNGPQITVHLPIGGPRGVTLAYRADGKLAGPGPVDIMGQVVIGGAQGGTSTTYEMQAHTTTTQQQIGANEVSNFNASDVHQNGMEYSVNKQSTTWEWAPKTTQHASVPTKPKLEHCNVGSLAPAGATPSAAALLTAVLGSKESKSANSTPGLRLNGTYGAAGGLKIEFRDDSGTLECGESRNSEAYTLGLDNGQYIVKFQNNTGPLSFILQPNGSLSGPASIEVTGRKAYQGADGHLAFTPLSTHCNVGTLTASK